MYGFTFLVMVTGTTTWTKYSTPKKSVIFAYKQQIKNINDLVRVMFSQHIAYCDKHAHWEVIEAARQRAEELLGIELKF